MRKRPLRPAGRSTQRPATSQEQLQRNSHAAASSTPATAAPKAKLAAGSADLVTPDPIDMRCAKGDAVEVQYAAMWYPAVVRELQAPRVNGPPPRVLVHVHGWDAASDAWEPLASDKLRKQQAGAKAEVRSRQTARPTPP